MILLCHSLPAPESLLTLESLPDMHRLSAGQLAGSESFLASSVHLVATRRLSAVIRHTPFVEMLTRTSWIMTFCHFLMIESLSLTAWSAIAYYFLLK